MESDDAPMEPVQQGEKPFDIWYSCDGCYKAIKPGKFRFDSKV